MDSLQLSTICDENVKELHENGILYEIDEIDYTKTDGSKIVRFFYGKSVFITGATGFLGKLLLEKILRTCNGIENVYLLIRSKKNKEAHERVADLLGDVIFSKILRAHPEFRTKIKVICGDISLPGLGICQKDLKILQNEVDVIFHIAATVRMMEKLTTLALSNIRGTMEILKISRHSKKLVSFVYVSTAYSFCPQKCIDEKFYDPPYEPEVLLRMIESSKDLDSRQKKIIEEWPNTYSFTKAIAEHAVKIHGQGISTCILRPGVVCSTFKEPLRSWTDNFYGMNGFIANNMMGLLRSSYIDPEKIMDLVPADYLVNAIIAAAYKNILNGQKEIKIYNYVSSPENPIKCGDFFREANRYGEKCPTLKCLWYPNTIITKHFYVYFVQILLTHFLPALLFDTFSIITGRKKRMFTTYKRLLQFNICVGYFGVREWTFRNDNVEELWNSLDDIDKKLFCFSLSKKNFSWNEYLKTVNAGIRLYLLKDDLKTIPEALSKHRRLYYWNICLKISLIVMPLWILRCRTSRK